MAVRSAACSALSRSSSGSSPQLVTTAPGHPMASSVLLWLCPAQVASIGIAHKRNKQTRRNSRAIRVRKSLSWFTFHLSNRTEHIAHNFWILWDLIHGLAGVSLSQSRWCSAEGRKKACSGEGVHPRSQEQKNRRNLLRQAWHSRFVFPIGFQACLLADSSQVT